MSPPSSSTSFRCLIFLLTHNKKGLSSVLAHKATEILKSFKWLKLKSHEHSLLTQWKTFCWVRNFTMNQSFVIIFNWCFLQLIFGIRIFGGWQIKITRHQKCAFQRKECSRPKLAQVMSTIINYSACPNSRHKNYYQRK